jgi:hypothetical protein
MTITLHTAHITVKAEEANRLISVIMEYGAILSKTESQKTLGNGPKKRSGVNKRAETALLLYGRH